jgi:guanine deaminase
MVETIIRGRTLSFRNMPFGAHDLGSLAYEEDGAVLVRDGLIAALGDFEAIAALAGENVQVVNHRPHLILPGFIDPHLHFPQMQVIGSFGAELLDWLNKYTFPEETKFSNPVHAGRIATAFFDEMVRHGTTTVAAYCSVHPVSADAFFAEAEKRGMAVIGGKCMMDRNAPDGLRDTPEAGYLETRELIGKWHGRARLRYAITPRFAITSTHEQLEMCGALVDEFPDCHVQTHLSENHAEIEFAKELFPDCKDYTAIYERYRLTGPKSLFGHCIHLTEREADALSESGSVAVFCPTSNLFLGSGLYPYMRMHERPKPVRTALATDIGGGTNYSLLRTLDEGYKVIALQGKKLNPLRAFWQVTRGNAEALLMQDQIGSLEPGHFADMIVLDSSATPAMALRMETIETLAEELFLLQTLGDDRCVVETYVAGVARKGEIS